MQFFLDHLSALLVGAVLMIGLPIMALQASESSRDATQVDAARAHMLGFNEVLGQDLANVGAGVDLSIAAIVAWSPGDVPGGPPASFEFRGAVQPTDSALVEQIRYGVTSAGTQTIQTASGSSATVPLYQIERSVWDGSAYVLTGASAPTVTAFEMVLLRDGAPLASTDPPDQADTMQVTLVALVSSGGRGEAQYARWTTRHAFLNQMGAMAPSTP